MKDRKYLVLLTLFSIILLGGCATYPTPYGGVGYGFNPNAVTGAVTGAALGTVAGAIAGPRCGCCDWRCGRGIVGTWDRVVSGSATLCSTRVLRSSTRLLWSASSDILLSLLSTLLLPLPPLVIGATEKHQQGARTLSRPEAERRDLLVLPKAGRPNPSYIQPTLLGSAVPAAGLARCWPAARTPRAGS